MSRCTYTTIDPLDSLLQQEERKVHYTMTTGIGDLADAGSSRDGVQDPRNPHTDQGPVTKKEGQQQKKTAVEQRNGNSNCVPNTRVPCTNVQICIEVDDCSHRCACRDEEQATYDL